MNTKKLLLLFTTSLVLGISLICKDPQPVQAKCRKWDPTCDIQKIIKRTPMPEVYIPAPKIPEVYIPTPTINFPSVGSTNSESCLSVFTDSKYDFLITNTTSSSVVFILDHEVYTLPVNDYKRFTFQKASGSDGCNIQHFPMPVIKYYRASGDSTTQDRPIGIGNYQFDEVGEAIFLVPSSK